MKNVWNNHELYAMLHSPNGAAARALLESALRVESLAKRKARANTGRLRQSITHEIRSEGELVARVGTNVSYATYVHQGTGLYGPHHTRITPTGARALRFQGRSGDIVFRGSVSGQRPNHFLSDALREAGLRR